MRGLEPGRSADSPREVVGATTDRALQPRPVLVQPRRPSMHPRPRLGQTTSGVAEGGQRLRQLLGRRAGARAAGSARPPASARSTPAAHVARCVTAWRRARVASSSPCRAANARSSVLPRVARCASRASSPRRQAARTPRRSPCGPRASRARACQPVARTRSEESLRYAAARPSMTAAASGSRAPARQLAGQQPRHRRLVVTDSPPAARHERQPIAPDDGRLAAECRCGSSMASSARRAPTSRRCAGRVAGPEWRWRRRSPRRRPRAPPWPARTPGPRAVPRSQALVEPVCGQDRPPRPRARRRASLRTGRTTSRPC